MSVAGSASATADLESARTAPVRTALSWFANVVVSQTGSREEGESILALVQHYLQDPAPANFRVIVNPLVGWIWIGALIALAGAVMAGWPAFESRRRLEAAYRARLGKELGTAHPRA